MRKPLASRKVRPKSYKTLVQAPPIKGYIPQRFGLEDVYEPLEEAIMRFRQQRLAENVKTLTEQISAQDNSDLNIIEQDGIVLTATPAPINHHGHCISSDEEYILEALTAPPEPIIVHSEG